MNRKRLAVFLVMAASLLGASPSLYAAGSTAKAALDDAVAAAKQWQPDAVLTNVSTLTVDGDGKATTWFYGFYSRKSGKYLNVTAKSRTVDTLEVGTGQTDPVVSDFLDSDKVMAEATKAGIKPDGSPRMGLNRTAWVVSGGNLSLWLNPRTGRLVKKQNVQ